MMLLTDAEARKYELISRPFVLQAEQQHRILGDELIIRAAEPSEFDQISALLEASGLMTDGLTVGMPDLVVAILSGQVVGCAALESAEDIGLLRSVAVAHEARGSGVGARLVATIHNTARARRLSSVYLLTTTAEGYFPKFGYRVVVEEHPPRVVADSAEYTACSAAGATLMKIDISILVT